MSDSLNLVYSADRYVLPDLRLSLQSFFRSAELDERTRVEAMVLCAEIEPRDTRLIEQFFRERFPRHGLRFVHVENRFESFPRLHGSWAAYLRLLIPEFIEANRVLYADTDTVCTGAINALYNQSLDGASLGAVRTGKVRTSRDRSNLRELGMSDEEAYFNSGVLLMDVARLRGEGLFARAMEVASRLSYNPIVFDQTLLNFLFRADAASLDPSTNQVVYPNDCPRRLEELEGIIHFVASPKPWDPGASGVHRWAGRVRDWFRGRGLCVEMPVRLRWYQLLKLRRIWKTYPARLRERFLSR